MLALWHQNRTEKIETNFTFFQFLHFLEWRDFLQVFVSEGIFTFMSLFGKDNIEHKNNNMIKFS